MKQFQDSTPINRPAKTGHNDCPKVKDDIAHRNKAKQGQKCPLKPSRATQQQSIGSYHGPCRPNVRTACNSGVSPCRCSRSSTDAPLPNNMRTMLVMSQQPWSTCGSMAKCNAVRPSMKAWALMLVLENIRTLRKVGRLDSNALRGRMVAEGKDRQKRTRHIDCPSRNIVSVSSMWM